MTDAFARHNAEQKAYFEHRTPRTMVPSSTSYVLHQVDELIRVTGLQRGDRVLEVGCGMGRYTFALVDRGLDVEGLDLSPVLLKRLREYGRNAPSITLHAADVATPPASLVGEFDAVVGFFTLHHLHDLYASYASMARLVRHGGRISFVEPNPFNPLYYAQIAAMPGMSWRRERGLLRLRTPIVRRATEGAGLIHLDAHRFGFLPPFAANRRSGRAVERALELVPLLRPVAAFQLIRAVRP